MYTSTVPLQSECVLTSYLSRPGMPLKCSSEGVTHVLISASTPTKSLLHVCLSDSHSPHPPPSHLLTAQVKDKPPKEHFHLAMTSFYCLAFQMVFCLWRYNISPEGISFSNVFLFEIGGGSDIFIPFPFLSNKKAQCGNRSPKNRTYLTHPVFSISGLAESEFQQNTFNVDQMDCSEPSQSLLK